MISLSKCLKEAIFIMMEEQTILKLIVNTITKLCTHNVYRAHTFICLLRWNFWIIAYQLLYLVSSTVLGYYRPRKYSKANQTSESPAWRYCLPLGIYIRSIQVTSQEHLQHKYKLLLTLLSKNE